MEIFTQSLALGQTVQFLSLVLHVNIQTVVVTSCNRTEKMLTTFKSVFSIPNDRLVIKYDPDNKKSSDFESDRCKPLSPYPKCPQLSLFGKKFSINRSEYKPCIGIAITKNRTDLELLINHGSDFTGFDHRRSYDYDVFEKIMKLVLSSGYDVITLNTDTSLEEKIYLISQLCDCVIGYEGGVMHLAHCFDTPCIMLPWKPEYELDDPDHPVHATRAEKTHLDKSTYFLSGPDEILEWRPDKLRQILQQLKNGSGNNKLLLPGFANSILNIDSFLWQMETDQVTTSLIKEHMSTYTIGGYEDLELFKNVAYGLADKIITKRD